MNEEFNCKEDNSVIQLKLFVNFFLNLIGIFTGLYGYLVKPFSETRLVVAIGSVGYLVGTGIWTLYTQYRLISTLYRGRDSQGKVIWLRSGILYPQGIYLIEILKPNTSIKLSSIEIPVGQWIDEGGQVVGEALVSDLKTKLIPKFKFE